MSSLIVYLVFAVFALVLAAYIANNQRTSLEDESVTSSRIASEWSSPIVTEECVVYNDVDGTMRNADQTCKGDAGFVYTTETRTCQLRVPGRTEGVSGCRKRDNTFAEVGEIENTFVPCATPKPECYPGRWSACPDESTTVDMGVPPACGLYTTHPVEQTCMLNDVEDASQLSCDPAKKDTCPNVGDLNWPCVDPDILGHTSHSSWFFKEYNFQRASTGEVLRFTYTPDQFAMITGSPEDYEPIDILEATWTLDPSTPQNPHIFITGIPSKARLNTMFLTTQLPTGQRMTMRAVLDVGSKVFFEKIKEKGNGAVDGDGFDASMTEVPKVVNYVINGPNPSTGLFQLRNTFGHSFSSICTGQCLRLINTRPYAQIEPLVYA